jgi:hypothetical protein
MAFLSLLFIAVGTVTGWMNRVPYPTETIDFLFSTAFILALGLIRPPVQLVLRADSTGIKQPGHEDDHLPPSSAEDRNGGTIPVERN